jgi:heme oxygenase
MSPANIAPDPDATGLLPSRLRIASRTLHEQTERSGVMAILLRGHLPGYRAMLAELLPIYEAREQSLSARAQLPWLSGLDLAALARAAKLHADLSGHAAAKSQRTATRTYVARLQALGHQGDPALLAHVYTRYLGDLSGGQVLRALVQRLYPGQGTAFYEFGDSAQVQRLRRQLRETLARAPLSEVEAGRVVEEACWSFEQHRLLFDELAAD